MKKRIWIILIIFTGLITCIFFLSGKHLDGIPIVKADITSEKANITWSRVEDADYYKVFRKNGKEGKYICIGKTEKLEFADIYKNTCNKKDEKGLLNIKMYVDPSENPFIYTVQAVKNNRIFKKTSDYESEGAFYIEAPTIISVEKEKKNFVITWGTLKNAEKYVLYTGVKENGNIKWNKIKTVDAVDQLIQKETISTSGNPVLFSVRAGFLKNKKIYYSDFDKGFDISNRNYDNCKVLFMGDSITFGSPYKEENERNIYSYPWRIKQLTGIDLYNPSIPGASYGYSKNKDRDRIVTQVAEKIHMGEVPYATDKRIVFQGEPGKYQDFDVIVLAAGANDYFDNIPIGKPDSNKLTEFNGAVNQIREWIKEGNNYRKEAGKEPVRIVVSDLFYNNKYYDYSSLTFRVPEKNALGLKMSDYQMALNLQKEKFRSEGFQVYEFKTRNFITPSNFPYATSDGLHMTKYTYGQIGNEFSKFLVNEGILK